MSVPSAPNIWVRPLATSGQLEFWWQPPENTGGLPITYYQLQCPAIDLIQNYSSNAFETRINNLTNLTEYQFSLAAANANGLGPISTFTSVQPGNKARDNYISSITMLSPSTVSVKWSFVQNPDEGAAKWFVVNAVPSTTTNSTVLITASISSFSTILTNIVKDTYAFQVFAVNDSGWQYENTTPLIVDTTYQLLAPTAPTNLAVTNISQSSMTVSWTGAIRVAYYTFLLNNGITTPAVYTPGTNLATFTDLSNNSYYQLNINANNNAGTTSSLSYLFKTLVPSPTQVTNLLMASRTQTSFVIQWSGGANATEYTFKLNNQQAIPSLLDTVNKAATFINLDVNSSYNVEVTAINSGGSKSVQGVYSTLPNKPTMISSLRINSVSYSTFSIQWSGAQGASSYVYTLNNISTIPYSQSLQDQTAQFTNLTSNTVYSTIIYAINTGGNSISNYLAVRTYYAPPTSPNTLQTSYISQSSFTVNWQSGDVAQNAVFRLNDTLVSPQTYSLSTKSATFINLVPSTNYSVFLSVINESGSATTSSINVQTLIAVPSQPYNVVATTVAPTAFSVSWLGGNLASSYSFTLNNNPVTPSQVTNQTASFTGLTAGTPYILIVIAANSSGSTPSEPILLKTSPAAPSSPIITTGQITNTGFTVSWTGTGAISYTFTLNNNPATPTSYSIGNKSATFTGLTSGTQYSLIVIATNSTGSTNSQTQQITTTQAPSQPINITASAVSTTSFTLNWSGGQGATSYLYSLDGLNKTPATQSVDNKTATFTNLTQYTKYDTLVTAVNSSGSTTSALVAITTASTGNPPQTPLPTTPANFTSSNITSSEFTVQWTEGVGASSYLFTVNGVSQTPSAYSLTGKTATFTNLTMTTAYTVVIIAVNSSGTVTSSPYTVSTITVAPSQPFNIIPSGITQTSFSIKWTGGDVATSYSFTLNADPVTPSSSSVANKTATFNSLTTNTTYAVLVTATNVGGSTVSNPIYITLSTGAPTMPSSITVNNISPTSLNISWLSGDIATSYSFTLNNVKTDPVLDSLAGKTANFNNLTPNTPYTIVVIATNNTGSTSSIQNTTFSTIYTKPTQPINVSFSTITPSSFIALWQQGDVATSNTFYLNSVLTTPSVYSIINKVAYFNNISQNIYSFIVNAVNSTDYTGSDVYEVALPVAVPRQPIVSANTIRTNSFIINWSGADSALYYVYKLNGLETVPASQSVEDKTATFTNLNSNQVYVVTITAYNQSGPSVSSNPLTVTTQSLTPSNPTRLTSYNITQTGFSVSWYNGDPATRYNFALNGTPTVPQIVSFSQKTATFTNLSSNTSYNTQIIPLNNNGSTVSQALTVLTQQAGPSKPFNIGTTPIDDNFFNLTWSGGVGATSYSFILDGSTVFPSTNTNNTAVLAKPPTNPPNTIVIYAINTEGITSSLTNIYPDLVPEVVTVPTFSTTLVRDTVFNNSSTSIYVTDYTNNSVWQSGGQAFTNISQPWGLTIDNNTTAYVASVQNNAIYALNLNTMSTVSFTAGYYNPYSVTVAPDNYMYVSDSMNGNIVRVAVDGTKTIIRPNFIDASRAYTSLITGAKMGLDGYIYFCDANNNRIVKMTIDGRAITYAGSPNAISGYQNGNNALFNYPIDLDIDIFGNLYVCDYLNYVIRQVANTGLVTTIVGSHIAGNVDGPLLTSKITPTGIKIGSNGNLFLASGAFVRQASIVPGLVMIPRSPFKGGAKYPYLPTQPFDITAKSEATSITIAWSGGIGATSYIFYINGVLTQSSNPPSLNKVATFENLNNQTSYTFIVVAVNADGENASAPVTLTTSGPPPSQPYNITRSGQSNTGFTISWLGGNGATSYLFYFNNAQQIPYSSNLSTATFTNLTPGTTYSVIVEAVNSYGSIKSLSANISTTYPAPTAITNIQASAVTATGFTVTWQGGVGADSYAFTLNTNPVIAVYNLLTKTAVFTGLTAASNYLLVIIATNLNGTTYSSQPVNPASINGVQIWLDGQDPLNTGTKPANGALQTWYDKSGLSNNINQNNGSSQPTYNTNYITFNNNKNYIIPISVMNNAPTYTLFFLFNPTVSSNFFMVKQKDGSNTYNALSMTVFVNGGGGGSTGTNGLIYWHSANGNPIANYTNNFATGSTYLLSMVYDGTTLSLYNNGTLNTTLTGSYALPNDTATSWLLGAWYSGGTFVGATDYNLYSMIFFTNNLSTINRQATEGYLAWRYGINTILPANHPFFSSPPAPAYSVTTLAEKPSSIILTAATQTSLSISWSGSAPSYTFTLNNNPVTPTYDLVAKTATFTGLDPGTIYTIVVSSVSPGGSNPSDPVAYPTRPSQPLNVTSNSITYTGFSLAWSPATGATSYTFTLNGATVAPLMATNQTATFTNLYGPITYSVIVVASNSSGSTPSNTINVSLPTPPAPTQPTITVVSDFTPLGFTINWSGGTYATSYIFTVNGSPVTPQSATNQTATFTNLSVTPGSIVSVVVTAINVTSITASAARSIPLLPAQPTSITTTAADATNISIGWSNGTGATDYTFTLNGTSVTPSYYSVNNKTASFSSLIAATTYSVIVTAVNSSGSTASSPTNISTAFGSPNQPTNLIISNVTNSGFTVNWSNGDVATSNVFTLDGQTVTPVYDTATKTATFTGLAGSKTYTLIVTAVNSTGSTSSQAIYVTTPVGPPSAPSNITLTDASQTTLSITWSGGLKATSFTFTLNNNPVTPSDYSFTNYTATFSNLSGGTRYAIIVTATNSAGSTPSLPTTLLTTPTKPISVTNTATTTSMKLSWLGGLSATSYDITVNGQLTIPDSINLSSAPVTWTPAINNPYTSIANAVAWNGSFWLVGYSNGNLAKSFNGSSWTTISSPLSGGYIASITWNGSYWLVTGNDATYTRFIIKSSNGTNWIIPTNSPFNPDGNYTPIITDAAWNGTYWVAVASGNTATCVALSSDGLTWLPPSTPDPFSVNGSGGANGVTWNGSLWLTVGDSSESIMTSSDGNTWTTVSSPFSTGYSVAYNGTYLIAQGTNNGVVVFAKSTNGLNWTSAPSPLTYCQSVIWASTYWAAVGTDSSNRGVFITSTNGVDWIIDSYLPFYQGQNIGWNNSKFVVVGTNLTSTTTIALGTPPSNTSDATFIGLSAGTNYTFVLTAINISGSTESDSYTFSTPPPAPQNVEASLVTQTSLTLSWSGVVGAASYVYTFNDLSVTAASQSGQSASFINLTAGTTYTIIVSSVNANGTASSNPITVTTVPLAPTNLSSNTITISGFNLTWSTSTGATDYTFNLNGNQSYPTYTLGSTNTASFTSLAAGTTYTTSVIAKNASGSSPASNPLNVTTVPTQPYNVTSNTLSTTKFSIAWLGGLGASSYTFLLNNSTVTNTYNLAQQTATFTSLQAGTAYDTIVQAVNAGGINASSTITVTTLPLAPTQPTNLTGSAYNPTGFSVSWLGGTYATYYTFLVNGLLSNPSYNLSTKTVIFTDLNPGSNNGVIVTASNNSGNNSSASTFFLTTPNAPTNIYQSNGSGTGFQINWQNGTGATSYTYILNSTITSPTSDNGVTSKYAVFTNLAYNSSYTVSVQANNASGSSIGDASFSPKILPSLQLWLDSKDTTTVKTNFPNIVNQWSDKSGYNNHYSTNTTNPGPVYYSSLSGVYFSTNAVLQSLNNLTITNSTNIFYVAKVPYIPDAYHYMFGQLGADVNIRYVNSTLVALNSNDFTTNYIVNGQASNIVNYASTHMVDLQVQNGTGTYSTSLSNTVFNSRYFKGTVYELIIYQSTLTTANRQLIEGYLAQKWGTNLGLPTNHPHYSSTLSNAFFTGPTEPVSLIASNIRNISFTLSWSGANGATSYTFTVNGVLTAPTSIAGKTADFAGFTSQTSFSVVVIATNIYGSTASNVYTFYTYPSKPENIATNSVTGTSFTLTWSGGIGATIYTYTLNGTLTTPAADYGVSSQTAQFANLIPNTSYIIIITATNAVGSTLSSVAFSPMTLTTIENWYDAADPLNTGTPPSVGTNITTWYDKSGNSNNARITSGVTYNGGSNNTILLQNDNYNYLLFGNNAYYNISPMSWAYNNAISYFFVINCSTGFVPSGVGALFGNPSYASFRLTIQNGQIQPLTAGSSVNLSSAYINYRPILISVTFNSSYVQNLYLNGYNQPVVTSTASGYLTTNTASSLGYDGGWGFNDGLMREIIFYQGVLSTANRQSVEGYLAWKWGIQSATLYSPNNYLILQQTLTDTGSNPQTVTNNNVTNSTTLGKLCAYFNNSTSTYLSLPFSYASFTICYWFNVIDNGYYNPWSLSNAASGSSYGINPDLNNGSQQFYFNFTGGTVNPGNWSYPTASGTWYHVAVTCNTSTATCQSYLNGVYKNTATGSGTLRNSSYLILGKAGDNGRAYNGYLQYFSVFNSVLTATQITNIYNSQVNSLPNDHPYYASTPSGGFNMTTGPYAPTNLNTTGGSTTSLSISWSGAAVATSFTFTLNGITTTPNSSTSIAATFTGLTVATEYNIVVTSVNNFGKTASAIFTTYTAPSQPILSTSNVTGYSFTVSWTGGTYATSYSYTLNGLSTTPSSDQGLASKTATFTNLSPNTAYTIIVRATNSAGSNPSSGYSQTTGPSAPILSQSNTTATSFTINWATTGATSYSFTLNGVANTPSTSTLTSATFTGLAVQTTYAVIVTAINSFGSTVSASFSAATLPNPPTKPSNLTTSTVTGNGFTVTWLGGNGATSYNYTLNGVATTPSSDQGVASNTATFNGLSPNTTYALVITAINAGGSISSATTGTPVSTLAGSGAVGNANGTGVAASFFVPLGLAVDQATGNVYVSDTGSHLIRKITPAATVTTVAGQYQVSGSTNGTGSGATFNSPQGSVVYNGALYICESSGNIRSMNLTTLVVTTYATGITGGATYIASDGAGNFYVANYSNGKIYKITNGSVSIFNSPTSSASGIAIDTNGNIYFSDITNSSVKKLTQAGVVTTIATGLNFPTGLTITSDDSTLYVCDALNHVIRKIVLSGPTMTVLTGTVGTNGNQNGTLAQGKFYQPYDVKIDPTGAYLYVADQGNQLIRTVIIDAGLIITTGPGQPTSLTFNPITPSGFTVNWSGAAGATSYTYTLNGNTVTPNSSTANSATFTGLSSNTLYTITVIAVNSFGSSSSINTSVTTYNPIPTRPTGIAFSSITQTGFTVSWAGGVGASSYSYQLNGSTVTPSTDNGLASKSAIFTGLTAGTVYRVLVNAISNGGSINSELFIPRSITGIQLWLDGKDPLNNRVTPSNGTAITTWFDKSSNGYDATGVNSPTYSANGVTFNGSNQYYTTNYTASSASETIFVVYSLNANSALASLVDSSASGGRQFGNYSASAGPSLAKNSIAWQLVGSFPNSTGIVYLAECLHSSSGINILMNGSPSSNNTTNPGFTAGLTTIGGGYYASSNSITWHLNGTISEVLIYNSVISLANRQTVEGFLAWRWNIQTSLPTTHPYYSANTSAGIYVITVPSQPTSLTQTNTGTTNFTINWSGGTGATSYSYTLNNITTIASSSTSSSATFTGLTQGATYTVIVTATNDSGSNASASFTAATINNPPTQPTNLSATNITGTSLTINWTGGIGATSYSYKLNGVTTTPATDNGVAGNNANFTGLSPNVSYTFVVIATNTAGSTSSPTGFSPSAFSTLKNWYDAADPLNTGTPPSVGTNISTWYDKSGNSNNAAIASGITYNGGSNNTILLQNDNYNYLLFGNNAYYNLNAMSWAYNNQITYFLVINLSTSITPSGVGAVFGNPSYASFRLTIQNGQIQPLTASSSVNLSYSYLNGNYRPILLSLTFNSSYVQSLYFNGSIQPVLTSTASGYLTTNTASSIGFDGGWGFNNGLMRELIFYQGALSTNDRQSVEGYLAWKWGLQSAALYSPNIYLILHTTLTDSGSTPQTVTNNNVVNSTALGKQCAYFNNSTNTYLSLPFPYGSGSFTICYWLNIIDNGYYNPWSLSNTATGSSYGINPDIYSSNSQIYLNFTGGIINAAGWTFPTDSGVWYHIALTVNGSSKVCQSYLNGVFKNSATGSGTLQHSSYLLLGKAGDNGRAYNGYLQYFSVYNSVLTATQITNIYNAQVNSLPQSHPYYGAGPTIGGFSKTTGPAQPTSLSQSGATSTSFIISWSGAAGATSYSYTLNGTSTTPNSSTSNSATFTGLTVNTNYTVIVTAINSAGSTASASFSASTTVNPPTQPTGLAASSLTGTGFTVSWSGGVGATSYNYQLNGSNVTPSTDNGVSSKTATFTNLAGGNQYAVTVIAINSGGSTASAAAGLTVTLPPSQPSSLSQSSTSATGFTVNWSGGNGATSYTYSLNGNTTTPATNNGVASKNAIFTGLTLGTSYIVIVTATNPGGSTSSNSTTFYTLPSAPTNLSSSSITTTGFTVSWSGGSGATSFTYTLNGVATTPASSSPTSATFTGLNSATSYSVVVNAVNPGGSAASASGFNPSSLSGLLLRLDASDTTGTGAAVSDGSTLNTWYDKSGNNSNATATAGTTIVKNNIRNGLPVVRMTRTQYMSVTMSASVTTYTVMTVHAATVNTGDYARMIHAGLSTDGILLYGCGSGSANFFTGFGTSGNWVDLNANTPGFDSLNTYAVYGFVFGGTTNIPYVNGTAQNTKTSIGSPSSWNSFAIGSYPSQGTQAWYGDIAEILVFNTAINTTTRQLAEGYLAWKWGTQAGLPSNHPYYSGGPSSGLTVTTQSAAVSGTAQSYLVLASNSTDTGQSPQTITTNGSVSYTTVGGKQCAYFNNSLSNYLSFNYVRATNFTIAFWFNPLDTGYYTAVSISNTSFSPIIQFDVSSSFLIVYTALPSLWTIAPQSSTGGSGAWSFVTVTINQSTYVEQLYMNGNFVTSGTGSGEMPVSGNLFFIGRSGDSGRAYNGYIRKFSFFNTVLSASQILSLYNEG